MSLLDFCRLFETATITADNRYYVQQDGQMLWFYVSAAKSSSKVSGSDVLLQVMERHSPSGYFESAGIFPRYVWLQELKAFE